MLSKGKNSHGGLSIPLVHTEGRGRGRVGRKTSMARCCRSASYNGLIIPVIPR